MQFSSVILALSAAVGAFAVNSFTAPLSNETLYAGETYIIRWNSTDGGDTVQILLKEGNSTDLQTALVISSNLTNVGAVRWFLPDDIATGTDYALEITDNDDTDLINYSPYFTIIGTNVTTTSSSSTSHSSTTTKKSSTSTKAASSAVSTTESTNSTSSAPVTTSAPASSTFANSTSSEITSTGYSNSSSAASTTVKTSTKAKTSTSASSTSTESSSSTSSSGSNGAALVSYSSLMLAGGIAGAIFMAL